MPEKDAPIPSAADLHAMTTDESTVQVPGPHGDATVEVIDTVTAKGFRGPGGIFAAVSKDEDAAFKEQDALRAVTAPPTEHASPTGSPSPAEPLTSIPRDKTSPATLDADAKEAQAAVWALADRSKPPVEQPKGNRVQRLLRRFPRFGKRSA